jgi:hypothetical protein
MEKVSALDEVVRHSMTGFALGKAILEDYAKVVAKLESISEEEVKARVRKRTDEIFRETAGKIYEQSKGTTSQDV